MAAIARPFTTATDRDADDEALLAAVMEYLEPENARITLPPAAYRSRSFFDLEQETIFRHGWIVVARSDDLGSGQYVTVTIAGEPLVVVRDGDGAVRALSSVCRHRFMPLVEAPSGHLDRFECSYHRWTYRLDGTLAGAPHMRSNEAFAQDQCALPAFPTEEWCGFVFCNLDPAAGSLREELVPVERAVSNHRLAEAVQVATYERTWRANWKLVMENVSEAYHHFGFHPDTVDRLAPSSRATGGYETGDLWFSFDTPAAAASPPSTALDLTEAELRTITFYNLLPCMQFFTSGDVVIWARYLPVDVDHTRVTSGILFPGPTTDGAAARERIDTYAAFVEKINDEDQAGIEAVHRGVQSRFASRGHLSVKEEALLAFYRYLARALAGACEGPAAP